MRTAYVVQRGASIRREGAVLQIHVNRKKEAEIPAHDLEQLVIMGNVILTPAALDLLIERGVDTVFLTLHGRYRARLVHGLSGNVRLRLAQYRRLCDEDEALRVATKIVTSKIRNSATLLRRFVRRHGTTEALARSIAALRASEMRAAQCASLDSLRGCEGAGAAAYFRAFGDLIRADGFHFDGRNRRPPLDPVNALLSLGYTLLANVVEAAVQVVGLDPYVGALHALESGRPSLVCDLMEEYRAAVVDPLVVAAVNKEAIRVDDFEDAGPGEPVVMRREGLRQFVGLFERRMEREVIYPPLGKRLSFRLLIEQQARLFARFMMGTAPEYVPYEGR
jgi:CRISPR-associated protein Cas1